MCWLGSERGQFGLQCRGQTWRVGSVDAVQCEAFDVEVYRTTLLMRRGARARAAE